MISEKEKKDLKQLLALAIGQDGDDFSLTELLGFFYGVAITPEVIVPSEWLVTIFGKEMPEFKSEKQAKSGLDTLFLVYNKFSDAFHNGTLAFPFNMADPDGWELEEAEEWAYGFHKALMLRPELWLQEEIPLFADDEEGEENMACMAVITAIAEPESADELFESAPGPGEEDIHFWASLFSLLPPAVESLQNHAVKLEKERQVRLQEIQHLGRPVHSTKISRNDPCPCGSGKKYKKCCLKGEKVVPIH
ncbi:MAG: UPF0149 family protein [Proteobacteria bacterium]|nr:UPF0149 family protein [Pseudomonadota bacterium]MBU0968885.1 UPF0149 family protein [Pseudomonadota bacterium]